MTEVETLLLQSMRDLKAEIHEFGKELRQEIGDIKETQARMDERLKSVEKNDNEDECIQKRLRALESSTEVVKSGGGKGKATAITISLAGVGAVVWSIVKALTGAPGP